MLTTQEIIYLSVSGVLALLCVVSGILINFYKKDWLKYFYYSLAAIVIIYAVTVISLNFEAFSEKYQIWLAVAVFAVIAVVIALLVLADKFNVKSVKSKMNTKFLVYSALFIALSFALSYIKFFELPQGGTITFFSMLPIMLFSYVFGVRKGLLLCFVYGLLQSIQDPYIVHPIQYILDYPLAFMMIGLAGVFANEKMSLGKFMFGLIIATLGRYLAHAISGAIYFGSYGADFGINNAVAWGFLYNCFVLVDGAICAVGGCLLLGNKQFKSILMKLKKDCIEVKNNDAGSKDVAESKSVSDNDVESKV